MEEGGTVSIGSLGLASDEAMPIEPTNKLAREPTMASAAAIFIALLAALGWWGDWPILKSMLPGLPPMRPLAIALIAALGAGLLLTPSRTRRPRDLSVAGGATLVALISGAYLIAGEVGPGPAVATSLVLLTLAIALFLLQLPRPPVLTLGALSVFAVALSLYRLVAHLAEIGYHGGEGADPFGRMALNTAVALCLLGAGLFLHPRLPYGQRLFANDPHGRLLRAIIPWGTVAPVLLAVFMGAGISARTYNAEFAAIAGMALLSAIATVALWRNYESLRAAEVGMKRDREQQTTLRELLETVLRGGSLEETLDRCLEQLLATSWLAVLPRGGIHLMTEDGKGLKLAVSRNLTPGVLSQCAHLPLNRCLCGKAAATAKVVFADHVDDRHDVAYPGMADHGHYCVPMLNRSEVIGVLVLYLPAGAGRDPAHEEFLVAVTDILATFVLRQRGETLLREARTELEGHRLHLEDLVAGRTAALAHSEARTRSILSNMLDGMIQIDTRGTILVANEAVPRMFGYADAAELVGQNVNILMPEPTHSEHDGYLARYLRTRQSTIIGQRREVTGRRKDGTLFPMELATNELADETGITFIGMVTDITDRKDVERAREAARTEAERLARVKGEFLANMSHEIRTPLNAVLGLAQIGMRENQGRKTGETCERILDAGRHLLGVINDILDFSKMEAGKLAVETQPLALAAITDQIFSLFVDSATAKGLTLHLALADDLPDWVAGDVLRLNQILVNLVGNAIKFTATGEIRLAVTRDGDLTSFRVTDTGIGMNAEQIERLFAPFEQADGSTTRQYGGTGLGLAISRQIARLMGGDIEVSSTPGEGSSFTVRLPMPTAAPPERPVESLPATGPRLAGLRLLAAEDVAINRMVLADLLEHEGAQVLFAANGQEALDHVQRHGADAFEAVLMDIQMPIMDGLEATRRLRALAPALPVIGLTAHALAEERDKSFAAGMVDHVTKPIDLDILIAAILRQVPAPPAARPTPAIKATAPPATAVDAGIDWAALSDRYGGRQTFIDKLLNTVLTTQAETPEQLREAARCRDMATLAFLGHSVKGVTGNVEARDLHELARRLQDGARAGHAKAAALGLQLADGLDTLLASIRSRIG